MESMLTLRFNSPRTSSVGRLFDAVASLIGLRQETGFEGQAAMELEYAAEDAKTNTCYRFSLDEQDGTGNSLAWFSSQLAPSARVLIVDWAPMIHGIIEDVRAGIRQGEISRKFHNTLVEIVLAVARKIGQLRIVLSGGCFQNKYLSERIVHRLKQAKFRPYLHQRVPPNDGGIALGQIFAACLTDNKLKENNVPRNSRKD